VTRVLVTGAGGFIGRAVARRLVAEGHDVIAFQGNLLAADQLEFPSPGATHCVHTAWYTNHADYLTHEVNRKWVAASIRLADSFFDAGGHRFVGIGTCLEYDVANAAGPCVEDVTPLRPETLYACCKLELLQALERRGGNFAWARVFFVYGPGDRVGRLIPGMIERFSLGEQAGPTFGGLRRDYIHVDDLAEQLVRIALADVRGAINTGTGLAPSLSEIFAAGADAFGRPELALGNDETGGQPPLIKSDMGKFRRQIGDPIARDFAAGIGDLVK
jgi:nucleoside-diphosphate-sugar epimerase